MAGHSQFKNIMHRKGVQDARRARQFTRLIREVTVAARHGLPEPASNPRLRAAVAAARQANIPKDTVDRAIRKAAAPEAGKELVEVRYEGYGPAGVAVIVETFTDNRNRTASDLRAIFSRHAGGLAETNAVTFLFDRVGVLLYAPVTDANALLEAAIDAGAEDMQTSAAGHEVTTSVEQFFAVRDTLEGRFGAAEKAALEWRAQQRVTPDAEQAPAVLGLLDALNENEDVQDVYSNAALAEPADAEVASER